MYYPEQSTYSMKQPPGRKKGLHKGMGSVMAALLVIGMIAALAVWQAKQQPGISEASKSLSENLDKVWLWSDAQFVNGADQAEWTIRWDIPAAHLGSAEELAAVIFQDKDGSPVDKFVGNEGRTITGTWPLYGAAVSISLMESSDSSESLMVLLDMKGDGEPLQERLRQAVHSLSYELTSFAATFTSSLKANGFTANENVLENMRKHTQAKLLEQYDEGGTKSQFFYTNQLHSFIIIGNGEQANLQIAAHHHTEHQLQELTIGVPIINGDYSSSSPLASGAHESGTHSD